MTNSSISSPCIGICAINADLKRCNGCHRTIKEIANWAKYSENERLSIMKKLKLRIRKDRSPVKNIPA